MPPPTPCTTRPTMNTAAFGATMHSTSPSRNRPPPSRSGRRGPLWSDQLPPTTMPTRPAVMVAEKASEYHCTPPRSAMATGRTVVIANASKAIDVISTRVLTMKGQVRAVHRRVGSGAWAMLMGPPGARSDRLWRPAVRASWNLGSRAWWLGPVESTTSSELDVKHSCRTAKEGPAMVQVRSEEHTSELQSRGQIVCRLLLEKKKK